jgi:hypothetical protein
MRACFFFSALVAVSGCGRRSLDDAPRSVGASKSDHAIIESIRASDPAFARFGQPTVGRSSLEIALPAVANGPLVLSVEGDPARRIAIEALDLIDRAPTSVGATLLFRDAAKATDVAFARESDRVEEVRVISQIDGPIVARWRLRLGDALAEVRTDGPRLLILDRNGRIAFRSSTIFAVDAKGLRRDARLSIELRDGATIATAVFDERGLVAPVVVDPVWLPGPALPGPRPRACIARGPDGKVYLGGAALDTIDVFDPATNSFTEITGVPNPPETCAITVAPNGDLRLFGDAYVRVWTAATGAWAPFSTAARFEVAWVPLEGGGILAFGGRNVDQTPLNEARAFDPATNTWSSRGALTVARANATAIVAQGKAFVIGGLNGSNQLEPSIEVLDLATSTWSRASNLPEARGAPDAVPFDGKILIAGGEVQNGDSAETVLLDPISGVTSAGPRLSLARRRFDLVAATDGRVFAIGGAIMGEIPTGVVDEIDTAGVRPGPRLLQPRSDSATIGLADGRIFVAGGNGNGWLSSVEILSSLPNGAACSWGGECRSGSCASGVCCDTACREVCARCDRPGAVGTCGPAPATTSCGVAPSCTNGIVTPAGRCAGDLVTCVGAAPIACPGGLTCDDATTCKSRCTVDADCTTGRCDAASGLCLPSAGDAGVPDAIEIEGGAAAPRPEGAPKVLGSAQPCTAPSECPSGFCVDGVCCDRACTERCHSCVLPSSPGRCAEAPIGVDLRNECGAALSCSGTCGPGGVCTTSVEGSQCKPSTCTGRSNGVGPAYCMRRGVPCPTGEAVPFDCGAYACEAAFGACRTSCSSSDACALDHVCDVARNVCVPRPVDEDSGCAVTRVGGPGRGLAAIAIVALAILGRRRRIVTRDRG